MPKTQPEERRKATVAFRTTRWRKRLVQAAAERRDVLPSDYLREVVDEALQQEFGQTSGTSERVEAG
jgi:uncharacterized protein (DUF1778 family)